MRNQIKCTKTKHTVILTYLFCIISLLFIISSCYGQGQEVTLRLNVGELDSPSSVEVFGNASPLSWHTGTTLNDDNKDGLYEITFITKKRNQRLKFKFSVNDTMELIGSDNRSIWVGEKKIDKTYAYNEYEKYSKEKINSITYTKEQVKEDIRVLGEIIQYIHPNIYGFQDSISLQLELESLENQLNEDPSITNAYAKISAFLTTVQCSHTFTNPWNQGYTVERSIFNQSDKLPLSFTRVGKRIFIDKIVPGYPRIKQGMEIIKINNIPSSEIMETLSKYISADGTNNEKKFSRLLLTGTAKYEFFDIFYPLEYGSQEFYLLELKDHNTNKIIEETVQAISKTNRSMKFYQRYGELNTSIESLFSFEEINKDVAKIGIGTFAVQSTDFNWKKYIDNCIAKANEYSNLIIDIRGNEGGQGEVGLYLMERLIQQPFKTNDLEMSVRYLEIPDGYKKYISTWDNFPYSFKKKYKKVIGTRYILKDKYGLKGKIFKPRKNGFRGNIYLITDANNSSATQLFAAYAKQMDNITIVGQETGGNQLGTNGGFIFFLRLPHSKVEIDIPVIKHFVPMGVEPENGGIKPDIEVIPSLENLQNGIDNEVQEILNRISNK